MTPRLSVHFSIFGLVFFVLKSLLGMAGHWSHEKVAILALKPWSQERILIHRTWAIATFQVALPHKTIWDKLAMILISTKGPKAACAGSHTEIQKCS